MTPAFLTPPFALANPPPAHSTEPPKQRLRARVAYDGTNYRGWQYQKDYPTIQRELEAALTRKFGFLTRAVGASRTDAGVHARGQAFHFDIPAAKTLKHHDVSKFQFTLNQMLAADVRVRDVQIAPTVEGEGGQRRPWHAIYCSSGKLYTYRISTGDVSDPLQRQYRFHDWRAARHGFSESLLEKAAHKFVGAHDFSAFTNSASPPPGYTPPVLVNPVRTVREVRVVAEGWGCYRIEFRIDGAMYRMIRNIVGTILDVAVGKMELEYIVELFSSRDRRLVPKSAPARGLCLEEVFYDDWPNSSVKH